MGMAQLAISEYGIIKTAISVWQTHATTGILGTPNDLTTVISYALFQRLSLHLLAGADLLHSHHSDPTGANSIILNTTKSFVSASTAVSE